ncbi:MAG: hypothetical protein ACHQJ6_04780 [Candidatus Berkiellales bacterium]
MVNIVITAEEAKTALAEYMLLQREGYLEAQKALKLSKEEDKGPNPEDLGSRDKMTQHSWLDAELVDAAIRGLVGQDPELANTVGVLPICNVDSFYQRLAAVSYDKVKHLWQQEGRLIPEPLLREESEILNDGALSDEQKAEQIGERLDELERRNLQQRMLRAEARKVLVEDNQFKYESIFRTYLEAAINQPGLLLNNPANELGAFDPSPQQYIIPYRINLGDPKKKLVLNHYSVFVINLEEQDGTKTAHIKYYDPKGYILKHSGVQREIISFFNDRGYTAKYTCISEPDQKETDGVSCGVLVPLKAIDIVNQNKGSEKRLLQELNPYQDQLNTHRLMIVKLLQDNGYIIEIDDDLISFAAKQKKRARRGASSELDSSTKYVFYAVLLGVSAFAIGFATYVFNYAFVANPLLSLALLGIGCGIGYSFKSIEQIIENAARKHLAKPAPAQLEQEEERVSLEQEEKLSELLSQDNDEAQPQEEARSEKALSEEEEQVQAQEPATGSEQPAVENVELHRENAEDAVSAPSEPGSEAGQDVPSEQGKEEKEKGAKQKAAKEKAVEVEDISADANPPILLKANAGKHQSRAGKGAATHARESDGASPVKGRATSGTKSRVGASASPVKSAKPSGKKQRLRT